MRLKQKLDILEDKLKNLGSGVIAFSGGVDSTFLLKVAAKVLKSNILAVTAVSETYPKEEQRQLKSLATTLNVRHRLIRTQEFKDPRFWRNPANRCYYCKSELFSRLAAVARKKSLKFVMDGSNADDLKDYRPGTLAKKEWCVVSPLQEAGLTKKEIRVLSRRLGLATWNKPALACLASRIPYGEPITRKRLQRIERSEEILKKNFRLKGNVRVRDYGTRARIEVDKREIVKLKDRDRLKDVLTPLGYATIEVDPAGYRMGSLNKKVNGK